MISRRGFFGLLAGAAVCPLFGQKSRYGGPTEGHSYTFHYRNFICDDVVSSKNINKYFKRDPMTYDDYCRVFTWKNTPSTLYWSKEAE